MILSNCLRTLPAKPLAFVLLFTLATPQNAGAQTPPVPDSGQVIRELPPAPGTDSVPLLPHPDGALDNVAELAPDQGKVFVKEIIITGNDEIPAATLRPLLDPFIGGQQTLARLNAATRRVTAYYRRHGFPVARAYLPLQDITEGTVTLAVIEGRIASHKIDNRSRVSDERIQAHFHQVKDGDVIKSAQIDRSLLLIQDTPGVASSRATLQPGASPGTSELLIAIEPAKTISGNLTADNHGNRYTGEYRLAGAVDLASPLKIGDELSLNALTSGEGLNYGRAAYRLPIGSDGFQLGAAYFITRYKLGKEFEVLEARGSATSASAFAAYPLLRSPLKNLSAVISLEDKRLEDSIEATLTDTDREIATATLGFSGSLQDTLGGGGVNRLELSLVRGDLDIVTPAARAADQVSARTAGSYTRISYTLSRLQRITSASQVSVSLNGQWAGKNLDSSEKISLGGIHGVRAYPQGEAGGDAGYRGTVEFRHSFLPSLQGTAFYDFGRVTTNENPFGAPATDHRTLSGAGIGLNAAYAAIHLRASAAWRLDGGTPGSIPASSAKNPMLWLLAALRF